MKYRRLGSAGIKVSEIGLGSWLTIGHGIDAGASRACIRRAFERGVNFFDSADVYAHGAAEECLGGELRDFPRRDLVIATKCYFPMGDGVNNRGLSRKHVFESIHDSLRRLRLDHLDLYQCHRFDPDVELIELVRAMDDLIRQGKILYWGLSEWPAAKIREVCALARQVNACPPVSEQPEYSIAARRVETNGVQRACAECGVGMVVWSPLKQGILSGKYSGGKVPSGARAGDSKMNAFLPHVKRELADKVDQLRPIAQQRGMSPAQLAIAWLLGREALASVIVGASRVQQVDENIDACEFATKLDANDLAAIDRVFPAAEYP
ncbi:MAG: aldo/keto reductase family protein [Phycisphaerae bacterium]